jgi:hypothetical protein
MATKATPQDIKDRQFVAEHFAPVTSFDSWLQGVIDTQEALLSVNIGSTLYGSSDVGIAAQVKQASINMVCVDLLERRILRLSGNITEETTQLIETLIKMRKELKDTIASGIDYLLTVGSGPGSGAYSSGVVESGSEGMITEWD